MPSIFKPPKPTNSDPTVTVQVLGCLAQKLGTNFAAISDGQTPASLAARLDGAKCFSGSNKIPAALAPVEPSDISDLPVETTQVAVDSLTNESIVNASGTKITAIVAKGTGVPSSSVFLYVFSNDPMVLRAETDSSGKWTYVLENPLKPGHHKVYAVSQADASSFVRTPAVPVTIAAAASGSEDGSLVIENGLSSAQVTYVAIAALMVAIAIFLLVRLVRTKRIARPVAPVIIQPQSGEAPPLPVTPAAPTPPPGPPPPTDPPASAA
jgi:hypothetical protein